ncbi:SCO family protein [Alteromonadaceae bacterium BrNp21-10]|nr:SCO family protein [Alteromonadaceae bacterium BrNp21-10]
MHKIKVVVIGLLLLSALIAGVMMSSHYQQGAKQPEFINLYPAPRVLPEFSLIDQHGQSFTQAQLRQHWTLVFMGYTFCPDICPTTLAELKSIYPQLQAIETTNPIQVLFISVDPKRDSQQRLLEYINFFHQDFIAATAGHEVLFPLVRGMGMMYGMNGSTEEDNYLVDHSAAIVLINPLAQVIGRFKPQHKLGQTPVSDGAQILNDLPILISNH